MATFRFNGCSPDVPKTQIEIVRQNPSFLDFLMCQDLGKIRIMDTHRPALWHKLHDETDREIGKIDGDHDFNYVEIYEPEHYWFIYDLVAKYEAQNPRKVVIDCDFVQDQIPERVSN